MQASFFLLMSFVVALTSPDASREARFANPPGDCRLLPIRHHYPFDPAANVAEIAQLRERGFGGFAGNVDTGSFDAPGPRYVENEAAWPALKAGLDFARTSGMAVWLYDELGYPSLSAGDLVLRGHPELEQTGWFVATAAAKGGERVTLDVPPGRFLAAVAAKTDAEGRLLADAFVDVSASVGDARPLPAPFAAARTKPYDAAGRPPLGLAKSRDEIRTGPFDWTAPTGADWRVYVITEDYLYEGTHPECKGMKTKFRYPNPLVKAATERFLEVNHGAYARHLGDDLGRCFASTFTDEPSLMGNWWRAMPYYVFSSAPELAARYRVRTCGRDLVADIPYLVTDSADGNATSGRLRIAFWDESARLYETSFFKTLSGWCRAHGFQSGGHLMGEETFAFHVSHYGDFFRCLKALDAPSIDCLTSIPTNVPYLAALFAGSARELTGATHTMVEVSSHSENARKPRYQVSEDEVQGTLNRLLWGGINTFTSYYGWGAFSDGQTRAINLRLGRASTLLLRDGHSAADVALFYPAKDAMRVYRPQSCVWRDAGTPVRALQETFDAAARSLYEDGRCFLIVDEETIENATVEGDALAFGKLRFRAVVLPDVKTLSEKAAAVLGAFASAGGTLVRADGRTDVAARLRDELEPHVSFPRYGTDALPVRVAHRRTSDGDVFFVMNDSARPYRGSARICGDPEDVTLWNLSDGSFVPAPRTPGGRVKVTLPPFRACVLTTKTACEPRRRPTAEKPRPRPDLLATKPASSLRNLAADVAKADVGWSATSVVKETDRDSFHFLVWSLASAPLGPDDAGIRVTVEVPEDCAVAPHLGVFLEVPQVALFFCGSMQSLGQKGVWTVEFPFAKFRPHRSRGAFSPEDVLGLRVGFGGFKAPAGTRTSFVVRSVEVFR